MFLYVSNEFNPDPVYVDEFDLSSDAKDKYLLVKFTKAPFLRLPKSEDDLKKVYKKKFLYNIRWGRRKYEERFGKLYFDVIENDEKELKYFMNQVFEVFNERWKFEYTSSSWTRREHFEKYVHAIIELSRKKKAFLAVLYDESKALLSYGYCLRDEEKIYLYQHTTRRIENLKGISLGKILIYELISYGIKNRMKILDFMVGVSRYKYEWTKNDRWIYRKFSRNFHGYLYSKIYYLKYKLQFNPILRPYLKSVMRFLSNV